MSKQTNRSKSRAPKYKWIGHILVYFNDDERSNVLTYVAQRKWDFENVICTLTQKQIGIKFTYNEGADAYHITLQPKDQDNPCYGYTIGTDHVELGRLIQIAAYIAEEMLPNGAIVPPDREASPDW